MKQTTVHHLKPVPKYLLPELKTFLDPIVNRVEVPDYITNDPVGFMYGFDETEDQHIIGFLAALLAWGRRDIIIAKTTELISRMETRPASFTGNLTRSDYKRLEGFKHRTFTADDTYWLLKGLSEILKMDGSFERFWKRCYETSGDMLLGEFHNRFFQLIPDSPLRVRKHLSTPAKNSSCKRLNLYLRWVIRKNSCVDPGTMSFMPPSGLMIPLDVHVARYARHLGLLTRRANDWKAVCELTENLRLLDATDPARYDYALFGMGIHAIDIPKPFLINP